MRQKTKVRQLDVEVDDVVYGIGFGQIQLEITGRCNMKCQHCRATNQVSSDMPLDQIVKIIKFAQLYRFVDYNELVVSGGEPLMHHNFIEVLKRIRNIGEKRISLTTNGSLLTKDHLRLIEDLSFDYFSISISLDSVIPDLHDTFRGYRGAFVKAEKALCLINSCNIPNIITCLRSTVQPSQIDNMEEFVQYAVKFGCKRIGFSAIQPSGNALNHLDLLMTQDQKKTFLNNVYLLNKKYPDIDISTTDPLKCLVCSNKEKNKHGEIVFGGCGAAVTTFNVNADGVMTPCALLDIPMMNVFPMSIAEIIKEYQESLIVKNMIRRNFKGKCGQCKKKYNCGGCRARAYAHDGDYLGSDPHCWSK